MTPIWIVLLAAAIAVLVAILWPQIRPHVIDTPSRDEASRARWRIDDTGTSTGGQAEMAIVLAVPGKSHWPPLDRTVIGTYSVGDNTARTVQRGEAEASAKYLNDRIEERLGG